ncbi:MAG: biotin--[acetyl-CoA-carboxylase] ligase [Pirellulales bacterium]
MRAPSLDVDRIAAESFVAGVEHHRSLASTQDRARAAAAESLPLPRLIVADRQTAGRGRGANRWWTGPGSLAFSLLFDPARLGLAGCQSPQISLAAGVAIVETVAPLVPACLVGLHWPNDVFTAGRKLAGVLVEVLPAGQHVLGIGLNLNNSLEDAPEELRETLTTLFELTGKRQDRTTILLALLARLESALSQLAAAPQRLGRRFDALCLQHGRTVTIQSGNCTTTGACAGIAPDGALLLDTPAGRRAFYSGVLV